VVVLDEGRIVESGSHHELLALGGHYATLEKMQTSRRDQDTSELMA